MITSQIIKEMKERGAIANVPLESQYQMTGRQYYRLMKRLAPHLPEPLKQVRARHRALHRNLHAQELAKEDIAVIKAQIKSHSPKLGQFNYRPKKQASREAFGPEYKAKLGEIYAACSKAGLNKWLEWIGQPLAKRLQLTPHQVKKASSLALFNTIRNFDCNFKTRDGKRISFRYVLRERFIRELIWQSQPRKASAKLKTDPLTFHPNYNFASNLAAPGSADLCHELMRDETITQIQKIMSEPSHRSKPARLKRDQWALLLGRFGEGKTLEELGEERGRTREAIRQRLLKLIPKAQVALRHLMTS